MKIEPAELTTLARRRQRLERRSLEERDLHSRAEASHGNEPATARHPVERKTPLDGAPDGRHFTSHDRVELLGDLPLPSRESRDVGGDRRDDWRRLVLAAAGRFGAGTDRLSAAGFRFAAGSWFGRLRTARSALTRG